MGQGVTANPFVVLIKSLLAAHRTIFISQKACLAWGVVLGLVDLGLNRGIAETSLNAEGPVCCQCGAYVTFYIKQESALRTNCISRYTTHRTLRTAPLGSYIAK